MKNSKNRKGSGAVFTFLGLILTVGLLNTACDPKYSTTAGISRPKTTATTSEGMNPQFQSATRVDASSNTSGGTDSVVGTSSTDGEYVLNLNFTDNGRNVSFQTVQAADEVGSDTKNVNGRYVYTLDTQCIDDSCLQVVLMVSNTDSNTQKSYQSVFVVYDSGNGYQLSASKLGTSYDYIEDAYADMVYGPNQN